mgnify:CR=1 FL=1
MRPSASLKLTAVIAAAAIAVCTVPSRRAGAYYPEEHQSLTTFSLFLLHEIYPEMFDRCLALTGQDSVIREYDGYSYQFVKEGGQQYQTSSGMFGKALDEGINWYYSDSYVHAPGKEWYDGSSPSLDRYSFPTKYPDKIAEFKDRFPMAKNVASEGCGVPYSVFMPVDNMARYWYERFLATGDPLDLGPLMHAVCDAGIPHHAAGYVGNWHQYYEPAMKEIVAGVARSESDRARIRELVESWDRIDDNPPGNLAPDDYRMKPATNWSIQNLTTWMALHACKQYIELYEPYYRNSRAGIIIPEKARELVILGTAMNVIVLKKALTEYGAQ